MLGNLAIQGKACVDSLPALSSRPRISPRDALIGALHSPASPQPSCIIGHVLPGSCNSIPL